MTKAKIIDIISNNTEIKKNIVAKAVEIILDVLKNSLRDNSRIEIRGFGVFEVKNRRQRIGRNPRNNNPALIKAGKRLRFKPTSLLKKEFSKLNNNNEINNDNEILDGNNSTNDIDSIDND